MVAPVLTPVDQGRQYGREVMRQCCQSLQAQAEAEFITMENHTLLLSKLSIESGFFRKC